MAGRGRGATLPAWMTAQGQVPDQSFPNGSFSASNNQTLAPPAPRGPPPIQSLPNPNLNMQPNGSFMPPPMFSPPPQHPPDMHMQNQQLPPPVAPPQSMVAPPMMQYPPPSMGAPPMMQFPPMMSFPGMPVPLTGRIPMPLPIPPFHPGNQQGGNNSTALDPNNDVSCWSEHINEAEDRKYWYNRATQVSTYEKPFWYFEFHFCNNCEANPNYMILKSENSGRKIYTSLPLEGVHCSA